MKLTIIIAIILIGSLIFLSSCSTTQKVLTQEEVTALPKVLEYSKGGCKGRCPIFDLTVYENGWMIFNGKMWTKQEGEATGQLTKEEFALLQADCQKADVWSKEGEYGMNIMDAPTTTIHLYEKNRDKQVQWRIRAPESLPTLSNKIMKIITDRGWIEGLKKDTAARLPAGAITDEIIVQFAEKLDAKQWCTQYALYGLHVKRTLSTMTPLYLLKFDAERTPPKKMLAIIKRSKKVTSAEFNKRMNTSSR